MEITVSPDTWIRNRRQTNGYGSLSIAFGTFWIALTVYFLTRHHHGQAAGTKIAVAAIATVLAIGFISFGVRQVRAGLWIASDQVIVRGPLRVKRLATEVVAGFAVGRT